MVPWPSSVYETADSATATGRRLAILPEVLPTNIDGETWGPDALNRWDGFSASAPIIMAFSTGVDPSNLVKHTDIAASVTDTSPTVLLDTSTGELVPHFAEVDINGADDPAHQALFIRSAKMLTGGTRYIVAIKTTLRAKGGAALPVPPGFRAILDGETTTHPLLEAVRPSYADIFDKLAAKGIDKQDLVVAWDFTTASRAMVRADLENARTALFAALGDASQLTFTEELVPLGDARFEKRVDGTFDAPLFLSNTSASVTTKLLRDAAGKPITNGTYKVPYTAVVPKCALTAPAPVPLVIYGHGLLGESSQVSNGGARNAPAEACAVMIGTDMRGMSVQDIANVVTTLNDAKQNPLVFDVLIQGMMNHLTLARVARQQMRTTLFSANGTSYVDPNKVYYYGISQGGIMGTTVCAIDPLLDRCVLQVGAMNYSLLLERSHDWPRYRTTLVGAYPNALDDALILAVLQSEWDRTEPTSVSDVITGSGFPSTPPKRVLMQVGIGDDLVPNLGSEYQQRTLGIPTILPSPKMSWGVPTTSSPAPSGLVWFDFGHGPTVPIENAPPPSNDVHGAIRSRKAATDMIDHFWETGEIIQTCTTPRGCDCTVADGCGAQL